LPCLTTIVLKIIFSIPLPKEKDGFIRCGDKNGKYSNFFLKQYEKFFRWRES